VDSRDKLTVLVDELEAKILFRLSSALREIGCYGDAIRYSEIRADRFPAYNFELPEYALPQKTDLCEINPAYARRGPGADDSSQVTRVVGGVYLGRGNGGGRFTPGMTTSQIDSRMKHLVC
jgi:hypothetical protein